ncbi:type I-E CRISPR-associated protein Cse2/CasB [Streptomyces turgidiscabies]|uniref:type I-E CRISPR-associated protein Cse2/CasB n=1 Tax=Streptomyces turgidiscabies TaxID=85558 RepID=UPI0038F73B27
MNATPARSENWAAIRQRRSDFVTYLYRLHRDMSADNKHAAAQARQSMALLRRCFTGARQEADAYDIVFDFNPPEAEQHIWLLTAGLFALHPQTRPQEHDRKTSLGAAMGRLGRERGDSVKRRFTQLVSVEAQAMPHYLRQALQLLRTESMPLDFYRLLDELTELLVDDPRSLNADRRQRIRLTWARDYHRASRPASNGPDETDAASTTPATL